MTRRGTQYGLDCDPADNWRQRGRCREADPEWFFVETGTGHLYEVRRAKAICGGCEVRARCLEDALAVEQGRSANNRFGVFGGMVPRERWQLDLCRSGRCRHREHRQDEDYRRLIKVVSDMAGQGCTDVQIGKRLRRSADTVRALRKANRIPPGYVARGKS